jgi:hypothetical protein
LRLIESRAEPSPAVFVEDSDVTSAIAQHKDGECRRAFFVSDKWRCNMFKSLDIQKDMEVVGLDGKHVGIVDHLETADRIILSKDDPKAGGQQHLISIDWVDYVDQKVHLNKPSTKATLEWQTAA